MKTYIYRPDKKLPDIDFDYLYLPSGRKYQEPEEKSAPHPMEKVARPPIRPTFIEVNK